MTDAFHPDLIHLTRVSFRRRILHKAKFYPRELLESDIGSEEISPSGDTVKNGDFHCDQFFP